MKQRWQNIVLKYLNMKVMATRNKLGDRELANDKASFFCRSRLLAVFVLI